MAISIDFLRKRKASDRSLTVATNFY